MRRDHYGYGMSDRVSLITARSAMKNNATLARIERVRFLLDDKNLVQLMPARKAGGMSRRSGKDRARDNQQRVNAAEANQSANQIHREASLGKNSSYKKMPFDVELASTNRYLRGRIEQ